MSADEHRLRIAGLGSLVGVAVLLAILLTQHLRHGWPFSLHHVNTIDGDSPGEPPTPRDHTSHDMHPRTAVSVSAEQAANFGVTVDPVRTETVARTIRAVATIVPDESRLSHVHTRVAGWIERLYVNTTGQHVKAGAPLAQIFSQDLLASQNEFLALRRIGPGEKSPMLDAARERLSVLGMTSKQIDDLARRGHANRNVTVYAPRSGDVLTRDVTVGTAVEPSTELMVVADLSRVWAIAEIPESDIPDIEVGSVAELRFPATGELALTSAVVFIHPTLSEDTRTLRVRIELENADGELRPGIYGTAEFRVGAREALTVSRDAVVDTGTAQHVFVEEPDGRLVPRRVVLGVHFDDRVEVREGLEEGELVVASGVFLIDSESRLRGSGGGGHAHGTAPEHAEHEG